MIVHGTEPSVVNPDIHVALEPISAEVYGRITVMRTKILRPVADSYLGAPLATNNDDSEGQADLRGV